MHSALRQYFGYSSFRPLQEEIIRDVLERKDVFVLMPTGGGKSICYQLPALLMEGVTVVVSPLISLMKDQVDSLDANGIAAACLNSTQSARVIRDVKASFLENRLKVLYIAPERLMMPGTFAFLKKGKISLFAIDEAHCISEWGHDFRPEYRKLKHLRNQETGFPEVPIIALTATATERVRKDIVSQLGLAIPPEKGPYVASFNRKNLYYEVRPKKETFSEISDYLKKHRSEAGIIYCQSRNNVESLTKKLNVAGFRALPYHAGLSDMERNQNQELFIKDDVDIIVATIAFGMGIDKSNVRFVIHYDLPRNLESYYQETGRGGRDGGPCECILFFSRGDRFKIEYFISQKTNEKEKDLSLVQLRQMVAYCESNKCRRQRLMEYFGEEIPESCANCDSCLRPKGTFDGTETARKLIGCVQELNQRFGTNYIIDILTGSKNKKIKQNRHEKLKSHNSGREFTKEQWKSLASEMINTGLLDVEGAQYPVLKMNAMSRKILNGREQVELVCPAGFTPEIEENLTLSTSLETKDEDVEINMKFSKEELSSEILSIESSSEILSIEDSSEIISTEGPSEIISTEGNATKKSIGVAGTAEGTLKKKIVIKSVKTGEEPDLILFERLKALRKEIALKKNLPPYIVFSDTTLKEMATKFPHNPEEFHSITGVGDHKLRKYGDIFLREIENYCIDYDLASTEKDESPGNSDKESENGRVNSKNPIQKNENPEVEMELFTEKMPISESDELNSPVKKINSSEIKANSSEVKINNSEVCTLPTKKGRYLDMSIQDWSKSDSPVWSSNREGSIEADSTGMSPESKIADLHKKDALETDNLKMVYQQRTYSLFTQGLRVDEIAEIQGLSIGDVFKQLEQLTLAGKVRNIKGLLPPQRQEQIKAALETLETEMDSLIRAKIGKDCQEEEINFVRAFLLSKIIITQSEDSEK